MNFFMLSPPSLEPDVLQSFGRTAINGRGVVDQAAACGKVTLREPGRGTVSERVHLLEALVCGSERCVRLVETSLLHQRATEHEPGVADLVDVVVAVLEELERVPGLLLGPTVSPPRRRTWRWSETA